MGEKAQTLAFWGHFCPFCCVWSTGAFPPSPSWQKTPLAGQGLAWARARCPWAPLSLEGDLLNWLGWWFSILRIGSAFNTTTTPPLRERNRVHLKPPTHPIILFRISWLWFLRLKRAQMPPGKENEELASWHFTGFRMIWSPPDGKGEDYNSHHSQPVWQNSEPLHPHHQVGGNQRAQCSTC